MKLIRALFILILPLIFVMNVYAADLNVDCPGNSSCNVTGVSPLFTVALDGLWYPGKSVIKTINVKNSSPDAHTMAVRGIRTSNLESEFQDMMLYSIVRVSDGLLISTGTLTDLFNQEKIELGNFNSGANQDFSLMILMNPAASNGTQNKQIVADLSLGFWQDSSSSSSSSSSPALPLSLSSVFISSPNVAATLQTAIQTTITTPLLTLLDEVAIDPSALFDIISSPLFNPDNLAIFLVLVGGFLVGSFMGSVYLVISNRVYRRYV